MYCMGLRKTLCCWGRKEGHLWAFPKVHADYTELRKIVLRRVLQSRCSEGLVGSCRQVQLHILADLVDMEVLGELKCLV
jgi:hypothetical protein